LIPEFLVRGEKSLAPKFVVQTKRRILRNNIMDITGLFEKTKGIPTKPFFLMHPLLRLPMDDFEYRAPRYEDYLADTFIPEPESLYDNGKQQRVPLLVPAR